MNTPTLLPIESTEHADHAGESAACGTARGSGPGEALIAQAPVEPSHEMSSGIPRKYLLMLAGWTLLVFASVAWNILELQSNTLRTAAAAARSSLAKDIGVHYWVSSHGGVYVPVVDGVEPTPYLQVPERDVTTMTGKKLTLMNPVHVLREGQQKFGAITGSRNHWTTLKLFHPGNAPDPREA